MDFGIPVKTALMGAMLTLPCMSYLKPLRSISSATIRGTVARFVLMECLILALALLLHSSGYGVEGPIILASKHGLCSRAITCT